MKKARDVESDAFGHALLDHLDGRAGHELVERSDGYVAIGVGTETYFAEPEALERDVLERAVGRTLDVGCGAGRHALYLQRRGLEVVGIDVSPLAVEVCRRRRLQDVRALSVEQIDGSLGRFDTVLMLGHNLALLGSAWGAKRILERLRRVVVPGGRILGDILDPYETDDPDHLAYHARNRARGRMGGQIRMRVRYKAYKSPWFDYLFLSREELSGLLEGSGWTLKEEIARYGPSYAVHLERLPDA